MSETTDETREEVQVSLWAVDPPALIYSCGGRLREACKLLDNGRPGLVFAGDVPDLTQGVTRPGYYRTDKARGLFQVGAAPVGKLTATVVPEAGEILGGMDTDAATILRLKRERDAAIAERDDARAARIAATSYGIDIATRDAADVAAEMAAEAREDARYRVLDTTRARREGAAEALDDLARRLREGGGG